MNATDPLWKTSDVPHYLPLLSTSRSVDVAIVGAGITGLTAALLLHRAGKNVAVIEARRIGGGVTGSTSAHLTEVIDSRLQVIESKFGKQGARLAAQSSRDAIAQIEAWVSALEIDCGFRRVPGYLFTEREEQKAELHKELEACVRAGMQVNPSDLPLPLQAAGAIRFENQAQFHPMKYLTRLAQTFVAEGGVIFEDSPIIKLHEGSRCVLKTAAGNSLHSDQVILATHSPLNRVLVQTKIAHYQSYVVSGPAPAIADGLYWDMEDPYHYIRSVEVGGARHLIVGGEDHKTGQDSDAAAAFDRLTKWSYRLGLVVDKRWSSQVVEPVDALPFIGRNAASTNVFIATGYSGNGLTFGTLAGMMLTDACLEKANPYAELYAATRMKPIASIKSYLAENIDFPLHLIGDALKPAEASSIDEVAPGEGKLVRIGMSKVAVYKSPEGKVQAVSSLCPHMGCHVAFNNAEKTWDCPCHGSRFGTDGLVIAGPALEPLAAHDGPLDVAAPLGRHASPEVRPRPSSPLGKQDGTKAAKQREHTHTEHKQ